MSSQHGVMPQECDLQFDRAQQAWEAAAKKMQSTCRSCIFVAARDLLSAGRLFVRYEGARPAMVGLVAGVGESLKSKDVDELAASLMSYRGGIDRREIDFSTELPETLFFMAVDCLAQASEEWGLNAYPEAKASTVRSRLYSGKVLEVG